MKERIISGVVLAALIVGAGLAGGYVLAAAMLITSLIGFYELMRACGVLEKDETVNAITGLVGIMIVVYYAGLMVLAHRHAHEPEIHRKYVDLQLLVSGGPEVHTFFPDGGKETVKDDRLDTPKDILFYENRPETAKIEGRVVLEPGDYAIYFPWDIHVPGQCDAEGPKAYRKIVLKVPVAACL